jgi:hypothetical protein
MPTIKNSPWGQVDQETKHQEGVYFVSTPGHGGFMVHRSIKLSDAAIEQSEIFGNYYCFEEDCAAYIVAFELGIKNGRTTDEDIKRALCFWLPRYVEASGNSEWFNAYPKRD